MVVIGKKQMRTDGKERTKNKENQKKSAASAVGGEEGGRGLSKLPTDLLMEILSRLSIHSLLQCKAVCVAWRKIVLDRKFAQLQHVQAMRKYNQLDDDNLSFVIYREVMSAGENKELHLVEGGMTTKAPSTMIRLKLNRFWPKELDAKYQRQIKVVGSHNGILCISLLCYTGQPSAAFICNPITGEYVSLPTKIKPHSSSHDVVGFGFDAMTQDYKVVATTIHGFDYLEGYSYDTEILTVGRDDSWRMVGSLPAKLFPFSSFDVLVNGVLHWIGDDYSRGNKERTIVAMDMSSEQFYMVQPPKLNWGLFIPFCLCNTMGNLSLFSFPSKNHCVIWEMKEYMVHESWTKRVVQTEYMSFNRMPLPFDGLSTHVDLHLSHGIIRYGDLIVRFRYYCTTNHVGRLVSLEDAIGRRKKGKDSSVKIQNQSTELALDTQQ